MHEIRRDQSLVRTMHSYISRSITTTVDEMLGCSSISILLPSVYAAVAGCVYYLTRSIIAKEEARQKDIYVVEDV